MLKTGVLWLLVWLNWHLLPEQRLLGGVGGEPGGGGDGERDQVPAHNH